MKIEKETKDLLIGYGLGLGIGIAVTVMYYRLGHLLLKDIVLLDDGAVLKFHNKKYGIGVFEK